MPETKGETLGVCNACQRMGAVCVNPEPDRDSKAFKAVFGVDIGIDEEDQYLMAKHRSQCAPSDVGPWCKGEGTIPQKIIHIID